MSQEIAPLPLVGVLQQYAWGGYEYLAHLLNRENEQLTPNAELWIGAHPKGAARIAETDSTLDQLIANHPKQLLGKEVADQFENRLPFLLKVLDVREMLSIQVHPDKQAAEAGFAHEEKHGPALSSSTRNYRDNNHKPELGVALSDFYLLHGFRSAEEIEVSCQEVPGWTKLIPLLRSSGVSGLYRFVMEADQTVVDELLIPVAAFLEGKQLDDRRQPGFWTQRAIKRYSINGHHDRGIFSLYWMNIVHLLPGEGIFQAAGIPHAYLEGICIELMANSDNVLRGGLTSKHIDVAELLKHTICDTIRPFILHATPLPDSQWSGLPSPSSDFALSVATPKKGSTLTVEASDGPAILFLLEGGMTELTKWLKLDKHQRMIFLPFGCKLTFSIDDHSVVYQASTPTINRLPGEQKD